MADEDDEDRADAHRVLLFLEPLDLVSGQPQLNFSCLS
jgi:hypothetical protein